MIKKLKSTKTIGYDGIPAENWKAFCTMKVGMKF
jgi:hypothetical protein